MMKIKQHFTSYNRNQSPAVLDFVYCPICSAKLVKKEIDGNLRNYCDDCRYIQYINPLPGVSVLIEKNGSLLIGRRARDCTASGKWCLPCGFVEHHENYLEAAHREVFEETGLEIKIRSLVSVSSNHLSPGLHTIVTVLTAGVVSGTPEAGDDLVELNWLGKNDKFPAMAFDSGWGSVS